MTTVQIMRVRPSGLRSAAVVNDDGSIRPPPLAVKFPADCAEAATAGSVWTVAGSFERRCYAVNGIEVAEELLVATEVKYVRPSGELLARWISANIEGIGEVIARRLVRAFPDLNEIVRQGDVEALSRVSGVNAARAQSLIRKWPSEALCGVLEWLQASGLPMGLAERLVRVYKDDALAKLKTNPFFLTAFGVTFATVVDLVKRLSVEISDEHLLAAIAEHAATRYCLRTGSTVIPARELMSEAAVVARDLGRQVDGLTAAAVRQGALIETPGGFQGLGAAIQEHAVARFLNRAAARTPGVGSPMAAWESRISESALEAALSAFEETLPFQMSAEQREAVKGAVRYPVSIISGGAGTGKTTILRALLAVCDRLSGGMPMFLAALSGRAAQRMAKSTGRQATTIAKLIADHLGDHKPELPDHLLLVVDEASMVDLLSAYKLVGMLPYAARVVLVGDAAQLPPVSGGLIFHATMRSALPVFELTQVRRQGRDSGIHRLATAIREDNYQRHLLDSPMGDCRFIPDCPPGRVVDEWEKAGGGGSCILLSPTRKGMLGVDQLNKLIQSHRDASERRPELHYMDGLRGWIPWITRSGARLRLGDQIMVTVNDYDADIRNGDLGMVVDVFAEPVEGRVGRAEINGSVVDVTPSMLGIMDLGYAITIHKSQGSQWPACILLLPRHARHMIDQTILYTAVTRPSERLIVMGDQSLITEALRKGSLALARHTNIQNLLVARDV